MRDPSFSAFMEKLLRHFTQSDITMQEVRRLWTEGHKVEDVVRYIDSGAYLERVAA